MFRIGHRWFVRTSFPLTTILLALLLITPTNVWPQSHERPGDGTSGNGQGTAKPRQAPPAGRQGTAQPRQQSQPQQGQPRQSQPPQGQPQRGQPPPREPHAGTPGAHPPQQGRGGPPPVGTARPREEPRHYPGGRPPAAPPMWRAYPEPRFYGYARPRVVVPIITYPHPYYVFTPRFWIGFGVYIGVPVPYPIVYGYPPYIYGDGVMLPAPTDVQAFGGVAFTIIPDDASVSVDGVYVGIARDFSSKQQPLSLTPGRHHIELQAEGRVPIAFDVDIHPGEVLPFSGMLQPVS